MDLPETLRNRLAQEIGEEVSRSGICRCPAERSRCYIENVDIGSLSRAVKSLVETWCFGTLEAIAISLRALIGAVAIAAMLANALPGPLAPLRAARAAAPIVALSAGNDTGARQARNGQGDCGWAGVRVMPMTKGFADSLGMTRPYGAIFDRPRPGSPAAKAHIEAYDVITAINGSPLQSWRDFAAIISSMAPGTYVYLTTWRNRQLRRVRVVLGAGKCPG